MSSDKVKFTKEVKEKWEQVLKDDDPLNWIVLEFGTDRKHKNRVRVFLLLKISNPNVIQDPSLPLSLSFPQFMDFKDVPSHSLP